LGDGVKHTYEAMFLVDSGMASSDWDGVISTINTIMTRGDAEVINLRKWDERRLAYDIAGHRRGTYLLSYFKADPARIGSIERDVKLNESLLRVLILRADHVTPEQMEADTPAMRSADRPHDSSQTARRPRDFDDPDRNDAAQQDTDSEKEQSSDDDPDVQTGDEDEGQTDS